MSSLCSEQAPRFITAAPQLRYVRLKKKLKLSARLQLGRDSFGSVGIREGRVCARVCVCVGWEPLVSRFNNLLDRQACDVPLREAANEEEGCLVELFSDPTSPLCPPCWLPLITAHSETSSLLFSLPLHPRSVVFFCAPPLPASSFEK